MKQTKRWNRLDNAAKIFPPTSSSQDPRVFRLVCELYEEIDPVILQRALEAAVAKFPFYQATLKKGLFWYYFEESHLPFSVREESKHPCSPIYKGDSKNLLFEVSYYKRRINLEVYHALSDGTGGMYFMKEMLCHYLSERYQIDKELISIEYDASPEEKNEDSFSKYYEKQSAGAKPRVAKAYQIQGEKAKELQIIKGNISVHEVIKQARIHQSTISEYLCAVFLCALQKTMQVRDQGKTVVLTVPINLRNYFSVGTARNFFGLIKIRHCFKEQGVSFEEVLSSVKESFKSQLKEDQVQLRMNQISAFEHQLMIKVLPLFLKNPILRFINWMASREVTAAFSNVGKIAMPEAVASYIKLFDAYDSTNKLKIVMCSYGDRLSVSFISKYVNTEIQKSFFRMLTDAGINVEIISNQTETEEEETHAELPKM